MDRAEKRKLELADRKLERKQELADLDAKLKRNKELDAAQRERKLKALEKLQDREDKIREEKRQATKEDLAVKQEGLNTRNRERNRSGLGPGVTFRLGKKLEEAGDGMIPSEDEVEVVEAEVQNILDEAKRNGTPMTVEKAENEAVRRMLRGEMGDFTGGFRPRGEAVDISQIPPEAIEFLKQNPGLRTDFDAQFGPGSAAAVLD